MYLLVWIMLFPIGLNQLINLNTCQDNNTFPQYGNTTHFLCPDSNEFYIDQNYSNSNNF